MPEDTPVEIHVYGLRYKPGKVLVYERGELVYETYTGAGSGQKREAALTVQDFLETLGIASRIIRHNAPPPRQVDPA
jgi:hypothetical protein